MITWSERALQAEALLEKQAGDQILDLCLRCEPATWALVDSSRRAPERRCLSQHRNGANTYQTVTTLFTPDSVLPKENIDSLTESPFRDYNGLYRFSFDFLNRS